jgi:hypothetical protein
MKIVLLRKIHLGLIVAVCLVALSSSWGVNHSSAGTLFQTVYPGPFSTDTPDPGSSSQNTPYPEPTQVNTSPAPTITVSPQVTLSPGVTLSPTGTVVTGTPTATTTLAPFPSITLLFPAITPTSTQSLSAFDPEDTPAWASGHPTNSGRLGSPVDLIGGIIVTIWLLLGGFLVVYLRRIGH